MNNIRKYIFPFAVICMLLLMCGCKKKETYTVTFDANGGTGTMQPQIFVEDEPHALRLNEFTCDNLLVYLLPHCKLPILFHLANLSQPSRVHLIDLA